MKLAHGQALRAVSDSLVHGVLGGWCWVNVILLGKEEWTGVRMAQVILCCLMAAGMDVDHMIEARSLSIKVKGGETGTVAISEMPTVSALATIFLWAVGWCWINEFSKYPRLLEITS